MKIAILGAAGVRTPLMLQAMFARQDRIGLDELSLMDIDAERLELMAAITAPLEKSGRLRFQITRTTAAETALEAADFVITTFRVGGIASRVVDERVPLQLGFLGQETTGPGGFAMGMRTIPVILKYVEQMRQHCPQAWLVNFANPAGMLAEAVVRAAGWERVVGICDSPASMGRAAAALLGARVEDVYLDYFGLNHLGWLRAAFYEGHDRLPWFLEWIQQAGGLPGLPFVPEFLITLGMIPNEYLYYYYHNSKAVKNILAAGKTRGEQITELNDRLFEDLRGLKTSSGGRLEAISPEQTSALYQTYLQARGQTYMRAETGSLHDLENLDPDSARALTEVFASEGYAGVALDLIEALTGSQPRTMILNIPNQGAIQGMDVQDVVEIPAYVAGETIRPLSVGTVPLQCLGLIQQVKAYEQLTIQAAVEGSYKLAVQALTIHPLVRDVDSAKAILDGYIQGHGNIFPELN
jgi:6-phospho-beta-glucosidase